MLLMPNKKKVASLIVASIRKPASHVQKLGDESETGSYKLPEEEPGDEGALGLEACMDDLLKAIERKDAKAMAKVLKNAMVLLDDDSAPMAEVTGEDD